ncbi:MAG: hypothetical protein AAFX87_29930 [Bacteroidota bacterium]
MQAKPYIRYLFVIVFLAFVFNKIYLRTWVLEHELGAFFEMIVYSIPNFFEAILGTIVATAISLSLKDAFRHKVKDALVYPISLSFASIYVITQELKLHNLGGNNVYDVNDLMASVIGLILMASLFFTCGFRKKEPTIASRNRIH